HYVAANGVAQGPVGRDHLLGLWNQGKINAATLVWKEGMANWLPATSPETGLALPRSGWRSAHRVGIGVAAAALCLLLAGLSYAAYKYWWRGRVISDIVNRDKDLSGALGLVVCGVHVTRPDGKQEEIATTVGSCFAVSPEGHLLTNKHVVEDVWNALHADLL